MKTYKTPPAKVVEINPDTLICVNTSNEELVEDEFEW